MDLTEAENMKKRWKEYTEWYKKYLNDLDNHDSVITQLKPDILEYEFNITMNKASGFDGIKLSQVI